MKKILQLILLISIPIMFSNSLIGQEKKDFEIEVEFLTLEELLNLEVVSASKQKEKVSEAPSILSVIPLDQINSYGWNSINSILFKQPGFFNSQDYDRRTVGARGLFEGWNNNHLLMLIDGIPFNDNQYGTAYTWEITPLFFTKSIEILRGPGSALYGSNATNGVVSINTISADDLVGNAKARIKFGNLNSRVFDVITGTTGKNFSAIVGYSGYKTDGNEYDSYDDSFQTGAVSTPTKYKTKDNRSGHYVFSKLEGQDKLEGLSLQYHYQYWEYETGHGWYWMIPSMPENMQESRQILSFKYNPVSSGKLKQEYVLRYQEHNINWNMQWATPNAWEGYYGPQGMTEYLNTTTKDVFGRIQFTYQLNDMGSNIIGGVETTVFLYNDSNEEHFSNIDINADAPSSDGDFVNLGPWFEWVNNKPVTTISGYAQYSSGKVLDGLIKTVIGLRYDSQFFNFSAIDKTNNPDEDKSFSQFSPRVGLLFFPSEDLVIKTLFGRAFRTPAPSEMFGANTWTLASAIRTIEPETVTTFEGAIDYKINKNFNLRLNGYYTKFENQVAYSIGNITQVANIYTTENAGFEAELVFGFNNISGFVNYSYVKRLDEEISPDQVAFIAKADDLTWAPSQCFNFGVIYKKDKLTMSAQIRYQGEMDRRTTDYSIAEYIPLRTNNVEGWVSVDAKMAFELSNFISAEITVNNIFDTERFVLKNLSYPFDYQLIGRQISAGLNLTL